MVICSNPSDMTVRLPISNVSSRSLDSLEILPILKSPINSLIFNSLIDLVRSKFTICIPFSFALPLRF